MKNIEALLKLHRGLLDENPHCYVEMAYTRLTGYVAHLHSSTQGGGWKLSGQSLKSMEDAADQVLFHYEEVVRP